jgi:hypothetical protein
MKLYAKKSNLVPGELESEIRTIGNGEFLFFTKHPNGKTYFIFGPENQTLQSAINDISKFFNRNPDEVILISTKEGIWNDKEKLIKDFDLVNTSAIYLFFAKK